MVTRADHVARETMHTAPLVDVDAWHVAVWFRTRWNAGAHARPTLDADPYYSRGLYELYHPAQVYACAPVIAEGYYDRLYERECVETPHRTTLEYWTLVYEETPASRDRVVHAYRYMTRGIQ